MKRLLLLLLLPISAMALDCQKLASVCVDTTPVKKISGINVPIDSVGGCWDQKVTYQCKGKELISDCAKWREQGCVQIGSSCIDQTASGECTLYEQKYQCPDREAYSTERTVCEESTFCLEGNCFDTSAPIDRDFGMAAVMMEAAREAGVYGVDPNKVEVFKGYMETCSIKVLGGKEIKSCCEASGGGAALSNYKLMGTGMAMNVAGSVGKEWAKKGSKYVFDALYDKVDSAIVKRGIAALGGGAATSATQTAANTAANTATNTAAGAAVAGTTFGAYGFEFSYSIANGFSFVGFDPYSFALQVGVMLVQKWLACDANEQNMSMKKGLNLCVHINSYCHKKALGVCIEKKERHCCFNSKLAKVINRQGRAQLGLPFDNCSGFTQSQLEQIDFTQIDFTEFLAEIIPKEVDTDALINRAHTQVQQAERLNQQMKGYFE